jgi:hypothetical protein
MEQRGVLRVAFAADAEVSPESSPSESVSARVRELSLHGCYLDIAAPYDPQSQLLVKIFTPGKYFEAKATVIHVRPASGMGLAFREIKPVFRAVLQDWLLVAMRNNTKSS